LTGYQINTTLPLKEDVKAILASAVTQLNLPEAFRDDPHEAIHNTRKTIKRIRALLKMIREGTGYSFYFRENRFFRDLSRSISRARDIYVLQETLELVVPEPGLPAHQAATLLSRLIRDHLDEEMEVLSRPGGALETIPAELVDALNRMDATLQLDNSFTSITEGLRRTYRKGRRLLGPLQRSPGMLNTHEFRKSSRYLQFQMELLVPLYPGMMTGYAASIDAMTEKLGHIRDLQRLQLLLLESGNEPASDASKEAMNRSIHSMTGEAYREVFALAPLIYAEKPKHYTTRIQRYWKANTHTN